MCGIMCIAYATGSLMDLCHKFFNIPADLIKMLQQMRDRQRDSKRERETYTWRVRSALCAWQLVK